LLLEASFGSKWKHPMASALTEKSMTYGGAILTHWKHLVAVSIKWKHPMAVSTKYKISNRSPIGHRR
jgi:hypothetical protein